MWRPAQRQVAWIAVQAKHLVPNAVTLANIAFGFLGIAAAADGHYERACVLLFLAALCDLADGRLARLLNASSKFGMELDSLSDVVSFGIAPAVLLYLSVLRPLGYLGQAIAIAYVLCGALRLARFNLDQGDLGKVTFLGCPIPVAAGYILSFVLVRSFIPLWALAVGSALAALSMVSTLKVPKFRKGGLPIVMLLVGLGTFVAFLVRPSALTWHLWNGWNVVMVVAHYLQLGKQGHLRPRAHGESEPIKKAA
jgi:CDP-diacylglycerol--serine O-phosphatidyltransferase